MKNILIVEDDITIHNLLNELLKDNAYSTYDAYSGTEALMILNDNNKKIDLILLDLMLPGLNGEEIIKKVKNIPIIVLSAKLSVSDKVNALSIGANDYITKPFNNDELLSRIAVQLRINNTNNSSSELIYKNMKLNDDLHSVTINSKKVNFTNTEYSIIRKLLLNPNQIISKSKLIDMLSEEDQDGAESSLKVHISNMRKKIRKITDDEYIESVWGIGFKMHD